MRRHRRHGAVTLEEAKSLSDIDPVTGCWLWRDGTNTAGYGTGTGTHIEILAHRHVYRLVHGKLDKGQLLRHTCNVRHCVNPDHLVPGTHQDNANDRQIKYGYPLLLTCRNGHPFVRGSYIVAKNHVKICLICGKR